MRFLLTLGALCLVSCSGSVADPPPETCVTALVTVAGDTVRIEDIAVPPENLFDIVEWWTEGDCP